MYYKIGKSDEQSSSNCGVHEGFNQATNSSGPSDISLTNDDEPVQPRKIKFPSHIIGCQYRSFNPSVYNKYVWLEYSECEDTVYCFYCRHFSIERKEPTFVTNGMQNWKRCYGTNTKFQSVAELHDAEHARLIKDNRHNLHTVAEVLLTAQQKIAQRETGRSFCVKNIMRQSLTFGQSC